MMFYELMTRLPLNSEIPPEYMRQRQGASFVYSLEQKQKPGEGLKHRPVMFGKCVILEGCLFWKTIVKGVNEWSLLTALE